MKLFHIPGKKRQGQAGRLIADKVIRSYSQQLPVFVHIPVPRSGYLLNKADTFHGRFVNTVAALPVCRSPELNDPVTDFTPAAQI